MKGRRKTRPEAERFMALVDRRGPDDCWRWTGARFKAGYGRFYRRQGDKFVVRVASRVAFELFRADPADFDVCHTCDEPSCVNPAHLFLGTARDNARDMAAKGRASGMNKTHCPLGHEYSAENTYWRPRQIAARGCRKCRNEAAKRYRKKIAAAEDTELRGKVARLKAHP